MMSLGTLSAVVIDAHLNIEMKFLLMILELKLLKILDQTFFFFPILWEEKLMELASILLFYALLQFFEIPLQTHTQNSSDEVFAIKLI